MTLVDVIIPAHDAAATIVAAVESCLAQSEPTLRVIVVDDGSRDDTAARVTAIDDPRITLIRQSNAGIAAAMNAGIRLGNAPFVARLDADDIAAPERHRLQLAHFRHHPDVIALSGAHREMAGDGRDTGHVHRPAETPLADPDWLPAREPDLTQPFAMFRRPALEAEGLYRPYPVSEDTDLYWRLAERGRLANLPDILGRYRMHAASISGASIQNGRRMAICSQLAALSARRRAAGLPDIALSPPVLHLLRGPIRLADSLAGLCDLLYLTAAETDWLLAAVAAKLIELAGYRPYELDPDDCAFVGACLHPYRLRGLSCDAADLGRRRAATAARLLRLGRPRDAATVAGHSWPQGLIRAATGRLYWTKRTG